MGKMVTGMPFQSGCATMDLAHRSGSQPFDKVLQRHPRCFWWSVILRYVGPTGELSTKWTVAAWEAAFLVDPSLKRLLLDKVNAPTGRCRPNPPVLTAGLWASLEPGLARYRSRTGHIDVGRSEKDELFGPGLSFAKTCGRVRLQRGRGSPQLERQLTQAGWSWACGDAADRYRQDLTAAADLISRMEAWLLEHGTSPIKHMADRLLWSTYARYIDVHNGFLAAHAERLHAALQQSATRR